MLTRVNANNILYKEEDDAFESDFASTDDETEQRASEGVSSEQVARAEEKQARKVRSASTKCLCGY